MGLGVGLLELLDDLEIVFGTGVKNNISGGGEDGLGGVGERAVAEEN